jgi:hypothetical protein
MVAWLSFSNPKERCVRDVFMMQRDKMVRPAVEYSTKCITDVQEYKQHCAGDSFFAKFQAALLHDPKGAELAPTSNVGHVDLHGYDGGLASFALQAREKAANQIVCCTICHGRDEFEFTKRGLMTRIHDMAEKKTIVIPGFPDVAKASS